MLDPKTKLPTSPDLLSERLQRLRSDFPDLFTAEGNLDRASLESLFSDTPLHREQYRFEWAGKHTSKRHAFTPSTARLQYDETRSVNPDEAKGNMIIEGDNLEVLKLLTSAYRGQVKCIYIDPPYNTGKDFVYSDNYTDGREAYWNKTGQVEDGVRVDTNSESAGRYHSDWLSMMHSRLLLARGLLRDDGVIFASIDDHEVQNLRKLMDDVFGEENFIEQFIWKSGRTSASIFTREHEYILAYGKLKDSIGFIKYDNDGDSIISDRAIKKIGEKNPASDINFPAGIRFEGKDKIFPSAFGETESVEVINGTFEVKNGVLLNPVTLRAGWTMKDMIESWIDGEEIIDSKGQIVKEFYFKENGVLNYIKERGSIHPKTIISDFTTKQGTKEIVSIFGKPIFTFPKPPSLIKFLLQITNDDDIILDFFAGSGTTGQAVMELNKEDGGNRQYILVQLPELTDEKSEAYKAGYKKISDITIERNKRVIQGYGESPTPLEGVGFRVYTLVRSAFPRVDFAPDPEKTEEENMQALEDYITRKEAVFSLVDDNPGIIDEVVLKNGFRLDYTLTRLTDITSNTVHLVTDSTGLTAYLCLDRPISAETVSYFQSHTDKRFICLEQGLDTTAKWNLRNALGDLFVAY